MVGRGFALVGIAVVGLGGCGSDGDGGRQAAKGSPSTVSQAGSGADPVVTGGPKARIQETIDDFQDGLARASGWGICGELSAAGRAKLGHGDSDACYSLAPGIVKRYRARGMRWERSKVVALDVKGAHAVATVQDEDDQPAYRVRFLLQEDEWTLSAADLDRRSGLAPAGG
jgi:hypothetical protein